MIRFDEDGNALESGVVTIHSFDNETREYISSFSLRVIGGTGIPAYSTMIEPPPKTKGVSYVFSGSGWVEVIDLRGERMYSTETGKSVEVTSLGRVPDGFTMDKPSTPYDKWDGSKWVTDVVAQHAAVVAEADDKKTALLNEANAITADWRTELALGIISDGDKAKLIAWMEYIRDVKAVDTSTAPDIAWPVKPA